MQFVVSGNLLRFTESNRHIQVEAACLKDAFSGLVSRYPDLGKVLVDDAGSLRNVHQLFLNGEQLDRNESAERPLETNDEICIITALAGG